MPHKDPARALEYQRIRRAKFRSDWIQAQGGACVGCGATDELEIDHVDPSTKEYPITTVWCRSREIRESELAKCQVLCKPCHLAKTVREHTNNTRQHGEYGTYTRSGCRCELCTKAASDYAREKYREKKRHREETGELVLEGVEHGTRATFARGCRCAECREATNSYNREYRARKRG